MNPKVYIIILNWNGWQDTIECLESVFRINHNNYKVIVCDNASSNGSLNKIKEWANGDSQANIAEDVRISICTYPSVCKPISYVEYTREQAEQGGTIREEPPLILIQTGANLGFAGGNNVGIKYALAKNDFEYIWLLNNDTVIDCDALAFMIKKIEQDSKFGICGSTLLFYNSPDIVQALGGATYNKWFGISHHVGGGSHFNKNDNLVTDFDYIVGASMLVSKSFLLDIGFLSEDYFLYYEELDWAIRAKNKYQLTYATESIVYHKEGATIESNSEYKSIIADYYSIRNRLRFAQKYYQYTLPSVYISLILAIVNRIRRKQWKRVLMIIGVIFNREKLNF